MKKIEKLETEVNVLSTFVADHKGILDDKTKGDLKSVQDRVAAEASAEAKARDEIAVARTGRDVSFENLQHSILESKKAVEIVVIRDAKGVKVPLLTDIINNPARINILAGKYLVAVAQAGKDPAVVKAGANLKASLDAFVGRYNETYNKVSSTHVAREKMAVDLVSLSGEVNAYRILVASRSSAELRRELDNRLKAAFPRKVRKSTGATTVTQPTTVVAALPAIPLTVVPPSSEHAQLSATA